ncbi:uncharacterized protein Dwil_GK16648 [Drosophila willistoni]|uniref:lysozyme n=1 Tax=Drosophila willistoni TaxID=7260 RepID=B4MMN1_DROWI|nr:uncharacterized protein Dwil_GK16648 [Drosophila willistoni]
MDPTLTSSEDHLTAGDVDIAVDYSLPVGNASPVEDTEAAEAAHHQYAEALSLSSQRNSSHRPHWQKQKHTIRNFLSLGAILLALMLIIGAIYLHLRQKHHLGRLSHNYSNHQQDYENQHHMDAASTETYSTTFTGRTAPSDVHHHDTKSNHIGHHFQQPDDECLACIALVATGNKPAKCSGELNCGIYRISHWYWQDAQQRLPEPLTLDYEHCVVEDKCAERIVRSYVERYARDCNLDGLIECRDHVMLHLLGPTGCLNPNRHWSIYQERLQMCKG